MLDSDDLRRSPLFSADWYRRSQPWVDDPVTHYVESRGRGGSDPHPLFWTDWYLSRHPESCDWPTPLHHFLSVGREQPLSPHPLFDVEWYASRTEVPEGVIHLEHYLARGAPLGVSPTPRLDAAELRRWAGGAAEAEPLTQLLSMIRLGRAEELPGPPRDGLPPPGRAAELWRWEYLVEEQWRWPENFVLIRIIGNDLPPRHRRGQSRANVRFILENEQELPGCERRWIVNRLVDDDEERAIIDLLEHHGATYTRVPFRVDEYRRIGWRFGDFDELGLSMGRPPKSVTNESLNIAWDHVYHDKNLYVMNNNGARNRALEDGRQHATWVLPFDGNCFFTREAWDELRVGVLTQPYLRYFCIPMARVPENMLLLGSGYAPEANEEPQLAFRWDAPARFDPDMRYGRRPKVELFYRLGIPGVWDGWRFFSWEAGRPEPGPEAGRWATVGWVARLASGQPELETDMKARGRGRLAAIRTCIDSVDVATVLGHYEAEQLLLLDETVLQEERARFTQGEPDLAVLVEQLRSEAAAYLQQPPRSVLDKTSVAPSGDPRDYWHPAPYWWPDPSSPSGLPYIRRDGHRIPGTELGTRGSEQFDRTALQVTLDGVYVLALAGFFLQEDAFHAHASRMLASWFVDPRTSMTPHLRYAQVRRGHDGDQGQPSGIIELSDIHYVMDAVRLLERSGHFTGGAALREWVANYLDWLGESHQGARERAATNNHGCWLDVQEAALRAMVGDVLGVRDALRRTEERVHEQIAPDGHQPAEARRTNSLHYHAYNLQAMVLMAHIADRVGFDLWTVRRRGNLQLSIALELATSAMRRPWPFAQVEPFEHDRLLILAHHARVGYPELLAEADVRARVRLRPVVSTHFGIRPFWQLGLPRSGVPQASLRTTIQEGIAAS